MYLFLLGFVVGIETKEGEEKKNRNWSGIGREREREKHKGLIHVLLKQIPCKNHGLLHF